MTKEQRKAVESIAAVYDWEGLHFRKEAIRAALKDVDDLTECLKRYEKWEANLILSQEAWNNGTAEFPTLTEALYEELMEIQTRRNIVLMQARGEE